MKDGDPIPVTQILNCGASKIPTLVKDYTSIYVGDGICKTFVNGRGGGGFAHVDGVDNSDGFECPNSLCIYYKSGNLLKTS